MFTRKELYHASKIAYYIFDSPFYDYAETKEERYLLSEVFIKYSDDLYAKATKKLTPEECAATHGFFMIA